MQLDVGSEPYLPIEQALRLLISHMSREAQMDPLSIIASEIWILVKSEFWSSPDGQTESDAYEPTVQYAQVGSKMNPRKVVWNLNPRKDLNPEYCPI